MGDIDMIGYKDRLLDLLWKQRGYGNRIKGRLLNLPFKQKSNYFFSIFYILHYLGFFVYWYKFEGVFFRTHCIYIYRVIQGLVTMQVI